MFCNAWRKERCADGEFILNLLFVLTSKTFTDSEMPKSQKKGKNTNWINFKVTTNDIQKSKVGGQKEIVIMAKQFNT